MDASPIPASVDELTSRLLTGERAEQIARLVRRIGVADSDAERLEVRSPVTGELVASVPACEVPDVEAAVQRSQQAQTEWARWSARRRARVLLRFHSLLLARQREVLDLIQLESGKSRLNAFEEVMATASTARYYGKHAPAHLRVRRRAGATPVLTRAWEHHVPVGVCGFITPWNYPLTMGVTDALAALVAGNGVVVKPDAQTPLAALWAFELLEQAGLPPGLAQVVTGDGPVVGGAIVELADFLMFTGSTATGRKLAARCGERLIGCSMELGGKNAMLVLPDARLERAVKGAISGSFGNAGQLCISMERIYVHRSLFDGFVSRLAEQVGKLKLGGDLDWNSDIGSMISRKQLEATTAHLEDAVAKGASVIAGGQPQPEAGPLFFEPTVLVGVTPDMDCHASETFGPLLEVYPYEDVDEAIKLINDSDYGLNASIFSGSISSARALAPRIKAGTVNINEPYAAAFGSIDAPMGGMKQSGVGRRHGAQGILKYTEAQTVAAQSLLPLTPDAGTPAAPYAAVMTFGLRALRRIPRV
ncbi:MAG: succinate-semialdehyde dehydrogenase (NADP(+)) [Solirubrobacterales bacterium]|nr:succinate-semialdehyde dehydrogenase (NADP(+)) [Solirubrobacterales bacterium]